MIKITGVDLGLFIKTAYALSVPQGLGFMHFQPGNLSDAEVEEILKLPRFGYTAVALDYVKGRAVKMVVFQEGEDLEIDEVWYDHTDDQLQRLLKAVGVEWISPKPAHGMACNCSNCQLKHGGSK